MTSTYLEDASVELRRELMCGTGHGPFLIVARPDDTFRKLLELITEHGRGETLLHFSA